MTVSPSTTASYKAVKCSIFCHVQLDRARVEFREMLWIGVTDLCHCHGRKAEAAAHLAFEAAKEGHRIVALVVAMLWLVGGGNQGRHAEVWVGLPDSLLK